MIELSDEERFIAQIFMPENLERTENFFQNHGKFAHYTSAETAFRIIQSKKVWMRNAVTMNDFSEIIYGEQCLSPLFQQEEIGGKLGAFLNSIQAGVTEELSAKFNLYLPHLKNHTYLTSMSEHDEGEDVYGRLSMWRAYAPKNGVALVINHHPFAEATERLKANSSPVSYFTEEQFSENYKQIVERVTANGAFFSEIPREYLVSVILNWLKYSLLCTKHPGFREEREWRVIYSPTVEVSPAIEECIEIVAGVPQEVHKIPLENREESGLVGADLGELLHRIIIGPSEDAFTIKCAFVKLLSGLRIEGADAKVVISNIPLRTF
ncbi:hypothetical protein MMA231_02557 [Asticcacaulis sp. MM231]|uniref:DUF2971 domain-containing protein n=1 Tax=Asticcacaulis sp. MM231 TaxID=3157666 RepID=UPI0032D58E25